MNRILNGTPIPLAMARVIDLKNEREKRLANAKGRKVRPILWVYSRLTGWKKIERPGAAQSLPRSSGA